MNVIWQSRSPGHRASVRPSGRLIMLLLTTATYVVCFAAWTLLGALAPLYREALSAWLVPAASAAWGLRAVLLLYAGVLGLTALVFYGLGRPLADARAASGAGALRALKAPGAWLLGFYFLIARQPGVVGDAA